jgi:hypothetical protein
VTGPVSGPVELEVAVRAWAVADDATKPPSSRPRRGGGDVGPSPWKLVFDTETALDPGQGLRVGGYQLRYRDRLRDEGLFYDPDGLTAEEVTTLAVYADEHRLKLHTLLEFNEAVFLKTAWDRRGLIVGHNLPFDLSRISIANGPCQSRDKSMRGGFTLTLSPDPKRSHVQLKRTNAGAAFIRLTIPAGVNPEQRNRDRGGRSPNHHGYFLDTATLGGALFGGRPSLKRLAADYLHTEHHKSEGDHGEQLTPEYLDYLRTDVQVTWECGRALLDRYATYQLPVPAWRIHSEAGIGKAHLVKMGLTPFRALNDWPPNVLAAVMETYYGGRAECGIRRTAVPGVLVDFTSQYPTGYALQGLQRYLIAERVDWTWEDPTTVQELLERITGEDVLDRELWTQLDALVLVEADGDRLPTRARYGRRPGRGAGVGPRAYNVAVPYRSGGPAQWYTLADCIVSKLHTGKAPRVRAVLRFSAHGVQPGLKPVEVAGNPDYRVDPTEDDFVRRLVELRAEVKTNAKTARRAGDDALAVELDAVQQAMKATANATSYGSAIEMNPIEHRKGTWVTIYHPDGTDHRAHVPRSEEPGRWFHPLIATLVASSGRLMLATAMRLLADHDGHYAFCDTDSLFIVATEHGDLIACPGGAVRTAIGPAVRALSWVQVEALVARFHAINPYSGPLSDHSILKIEDENFDPDTGAQREIECWSIAAKRYGLFTRQPDGRPVLVASGAKLKRSEHGLGHLLPPNAPRPDISDRAWLDQWWQQLLCVELGFDESTPDWFSAPAVGRLTVTSPRDLRQFAAYNAGVPYRRQVKPWGFLTVAHPTVHERARADGPRNLITPFERDPDKRLQAAWIDRDQPVAAARRIRADNAIEIRDDSITVLSYGDYFEQYRRHPEAKALDSFDTCGCHAWTTGVLTPHHVRGTALRRVGKESNRLADTPTPISEEDDAQIEYPSAKRCRGCEAEVFGRRSWCSEACRKRAARRSTCADPGCPRGVVQPVADRADAALIAWRSHTTA